MEELAKRFAALAEQYGPKVVDAALQAARMEAYSSLAAAVMWIPVVAALVYAGRLLRTKAANNRDLYVEMIFGSWVLWLIAGVASLTILWTFIDPWTWTTINQPELWIAKKALKL